MEELSSCFEVQDGQPPTGTLFDPLTPLYVSLEGHPVNQAILVGDIPKILVEFTAVRQESAPARVRRK